MPAPGYYRSVAMLVGGAQSRALLAISVLIRDSGRAPTTPASARDRGSAYRSLRPPDQQACRDHRNRRGSTLELRWSSQ
jgi:hypothetical protein